MEPRGVEPIEKMAITAHFKEFAFLFWVNFGQKIKKPPCRIADKRAQRRIKKGMKLRPF